MVINSKKKMSKYPYGRIKFILTAVILASLTLNSLISSQLVFASRDTVCNGVKVDLDINELNIHEKDADIANFTLLPFADGFVVRIPVDENGLSKANVQTRLYAEYEYNGDILPSWAYQSENLATELVKKPDNVDPETFEFQIGRDDFFYTSKKIIFDWLAPDVRMSIIPKSGDNSWGPRNITFYVRQGDDLNNLDYICKFNLKTVNKCSNYKNFSTYSYPEGILGIYLDRSFPTTGYSLYDPIKKEEISLNDGLRNSSNGVTLGLGLNDPDNDFLPGPLTLRNSDKDICEFDFIPYDEDFFEKFNQCEVKADTSNGKPKISYKDIPTRILSADLSYFLDNINPVILVAKKGSIVEPLATQYAGIERILKADFFRICSSTPAEGATDDYDCLEVADNPDSGVRDVQISTDAYGDYVAVVAYPSDNIGSPYNFILSKCSDEFSYKPEGTTSTGPMEQQAPNTSGDHPEEPYNPDRSDICSPIAEGLQKTTCINCVNNEGGVWSALGCIKTDLSGFVDGFFKVGLGVSGGIAFLFLVYGAFLIITSAGNPETIQHAREVITSAVTGILLIIFAVLIIQIFAVNILRIPGFN